MAKKKILIVDDMGDIRKTIRIVLEEKGYDVTEAVTGDDCLKKLKKTKPDLILMDIMMPGTPVKDVVAQIKNIKIAYLTAVGISKKEKEELLNQENVLDFIQKPFDNEELLRKVKNLTTK